MRPKSYKINQNTCKYCVHCFDFNLLYCFLGEPEEDPKEILRRIIEEKKSKEYYVSDSGICKEFKQK